MPNVVYGTESDDSLVGNGSNETMYGLGGNDFLFSAGGKDDLYGGDGDDVLFGGDRADELYGGAGADTFKYGSYSESLSQRAQRDTIHDFESVDFIDLSGVKNGGITSMDQVTVEVVSAGHYRVHVEVDAGGNPISDMIIEVLGVQPQESQFIFGTSV